MFRIAPDSHITDLPGVAVGHWTDKNARTGCTAFLFDHACPAAAHIAGGAPGSAETDLLDPSALVSGVDAILLTGGSAFGLDAAGGVRRFLEERRRGFTAGAHVVPIVPTAVIFDLAVGDARVRPGPEQGYEAATNASENNRTTGKIGVGSGARVAKYAGPDNGVEAGIGSCSVTLEEGVSVGALMVANCFGAIIDPSTGTPLAAPLNDAGKKISYLDAPVTSPDFGATAIGLVVTNGLFDKANLKRIAIMAHDGLARTVSPSHTPYDGDLIFALSLGNKKADVTRIGAAAAETVAACMIRSL